MRRTVLILSVLGLMLFAFNAFAKDYPSVPGELIVKLKDGVKSSFFKNNKSADYSLKRTINLSYGHLYVVKVNDSKSLTAMAKKLQQDSNILYAEPNYIYSVGAANKEIKNSPNDPKFTSLWGLKNSGSNEPNRTRDGREGADIDALAAWEITKGSREVKVAIIDTGIDYTHPDIAANMWTNLAELNGQAGIDDDNNGFVDDIYGYDFANGDGDPRDGHGHGTHCAGTIGAVHNNNVGVAGVMGNVSLVAIKFLSDSGSGTLANAVSAIDYATSLNVDIMSNSWGGGGFSQSLKDAIVRASAAGIIFVAAAGNDRRDNDKSPHYPSNYDVANLISVAAFNAQDQLASFSNYGVKTVHIAAPGRNILSTVKGGRYAVYSGTSMATPHVSGALGLLIAHAGRLSHEQMRERLMATSVPVRYLRKKTISGGRLHAYNLLTDTRPERVGPKPGEWREFVLDTPWQSTHPYAHELVMQQSFNIPGAKYIRLVVKKYDIERIYDFIEVANNKREIVEKIYGKGEDFRSDYVEGDTLNATFKSDRSLSLWGFKIDKIEYQ